MIQLLYIDLFCGAGGTSTGVNEARLYDEQCARVIACVNHDPTAIASHAANHPDALHFIEDIRTLNLTPLMRHIKACRKEYPQALIVLWASLECTNFSRAKGGQPRDPDSRHIADDLPAIWSDGELYDMYSTLKRLVSQFSHAKSRWPRTPSNAFMQDL